MEVLAETIRYFLCTPMNTISIYVTDDHPMVLDGLKNLLESEKDFRLDGCFPTGKDTLNALEKKLPDVLLLDINLPDCNGVDLSREIKKNYPKLLIIMLSMHNERAIIASVLNNKVNGYLLKHSAGSEIIQGIRSVINGETYLCKQSHQIYYDSRQTGPDVIPSITKREKDILSLIAEGYTTSQIADKLFISTHTVESHRKNLMDKFSASSMPMVIKFATGFRLI
ncbi:response regulator [Albibacterium indicum]|uniref:response regulator n=1 Tax=Albibacterium indicum TaxID=2292082 RepID=UPI001981B3E8|nr:response regulator transcription factor [Pedobacter indicus]